MIGQGSDFAATVNFRVGQDHAGRWLAMDATGQSGGMFATRAAALRFARGEAARRAGTVRLVDEPVGFA